MKRASKKKHVNGHAAGAVVVLTRPELEARAAQVAKDLVGVSRERAFKMLDQGKLRGTLAEMYLAPIRTLLA